MKRKTCRLAVGVIAIALCLFCLIGCTNSPKDSTSPPAPITTSPAPVTQAPESAPPETAAPGILPAGETGVSGTKQNNTDEKEPLRLEIEKDVYANADTVHFSLINETGEDKFVVLAPSLEKRTEDGWLFVPSTLGYCGTPSCLKDRLSMELSLADFEEGLSPGEYRIVFGFTKSDRDFSSAEEIFDTFLLE